MYEADMLRMHKTTIPYVTKLCYCAYQTVVLVNAIGLIYTFLYWNWKYL